MKISKCPVCGKKLKVKTFYCPDCNIEIKGNFEQSDLAGINPDILRFIKVFIFVEGNIKQIEKILNFSYPKVKNYLKKAKEALNLTEETISKEIGIDSKNIQNEIQIEYTTKQKDSENKSIEKIKILEMLDSGQITYEEALKLLKKL